MVMAVMVVLAAGLFASQYAVREQTYVMQDQYKILSILNQAKSLTLGAFMREQDVIGENVLCGYGLYFKAPRTVVLYKDKLSSSDISMISSNKYSASYVCSLKGQHDQGYNSLSSGGPDEEVQSGTFELNKTESFESDSENVSIMFLAPYLETSIIKNNTDVSEATIVLKTAKSDVRGSIKINKFGQVTTE